MKPGLYTAFLTLLFISTGGEEDRVACEEEVRKLAAAGNWPVHIIPNVGHNSIFEAHRQWRDLVLDFLNKS